ncbi:M28 family peptidase [Nonomuraea typhae]|uniref:Vacuolar membrane protease n=1 Tax=Nonomuraea typhae TaxID=2603600 RepID=A0ABW7YV39_9ACTN
MSRFISLFVLAALLAVTLVDLAPPAPRSSTTGFSATRALGDVKEIAKAPHPTGSPENDRVREHLVRRLTALSLDTRVHESVGVFPIKHDGLASVGRVRNIVATRPGTASTGRVILAAHYDSAPGAPGAGDDGAGIATLLEVARTLPQNLRNDVIFLLTDAEEPGLLGAEAFARDNRFDGPVVVLNHEARGVRGTVQMFRSAGPLAEVYGSAAPHPSADSAFASLMAVMPNNTDFHVFDQAGWTGLDSAFIGGGAYYHTPLDDPAHLDPGSLQQMGDNALAVATALAGRDLRAPGSGASVFFTVPGGMIRYPGWLEIPVAALALALVAGLIVLLRRRGQVTLPRTLGAAGLSLVTVVLAGAWGYALWPLLKVLRPDYGAMFTGDPYRPWWYQAALLVFVAAIVLVCVVLFRRLTTPRLATPPPATPARSVTPPVPGSVTPPVPGSPVSSSHGGGDERSLTGPAAGALLLVALLGLLSALLLPGGSHGFAWPALFAALGWMVSLFLPRGGLVALTLGLVPAAVMLGSTALTSLDIGLRIGGVISAPHFALLLLLLLPILAFAPRRRTVMAFAPRRRTVLAVLPVAAVALIAAGLVADRFDTAHPRQDAVAYAVDTAAKEARWGRFGGVSADSARFFGDVDMVTSPAPVAPLRAPELTVLKDVTSGGTRTLTVRLTPAGPAPAVGLGVGKPGAKITVAGRDLGERSGFTFHAPPAGGVEATLVVPAGETQIRIFQHAYDMSVIPGYRLPAETMQMRPLTTAFLTKIVAPAR